LPETPGVWRYTLRLKNLDVVTPFQAPVTVEVTHHSGVARRGSISACIAHDTKPALNCKPSYVVP